MTTDHPVWFVPVAGCGGKIGMTPCPGTKKASLDASLIVLKDEGVEAVLTLMMADEMERNNVSDLDEKVTQHGMKWFHLPIRDDQAPGEEFREGWDKYRNQVHDLLSKGKHIAIHCKGGSGRTGLIAIQILLERGVSLEDASLLVKSQRPKALTPVPHQDYIQAFAQSLS
ncbi:cyclin-dependent kinase inhibitor 3 family protein [Sansalvadorimonas sp. 2012CJ34-2]|uniref:Cyclin-dependent kinase inhibitor 3 family protein n=1 Tax=Parendozoicomonas callyspongiae TaxID=2942213 RepID=A0ABT0PBU8_9GAMM|nr:cyclin-dependent kinase inhibitor 3 family protein [Sansalvadorimonas sp. 2012CJ34-2]MCL6268854.1 cyclin-dependent kinase inhibitor 3 family protein [Sansalvadorimonas sp. 2012CJ34-2]